MTLLRPTILALLTAAAPAFAQSTDADFAALSKARQFTELQALAKARAVQNPKDDVALWYWVRSSGGDAAQRADLTARAEACVAALPQSARCHSALGVLYGQAATSGGMTAGMKLAGRIKDAFFKAVDLEPRNFALRRDLNQFYLQAPGIAGGSVRKAFQNADAFAQIDAPRGQMLRAEVHAYEKEFPQAEALLAGIKPGADTELAQALNTSTLSFGFALLEAEEPARAQKAFERALALDASGPAGSTAQLGLGRALLAQSQTEAAIAALERSLQLDPKSRAHYRLGQAYQAKGDMPKARASYKQFLLLVSDGKAADDARKRLASLGG
jgi:tetratricopeptide (TPR) repeat protein